ncbi:MAG: glutamine amidotransferase [Gammaproteobacteria bacterium]|nr:glutamine amidotransferase [Gammaproteobacteria bacterium]
MTTKKTEDRWGDDRKAWAITHVAFEDLGSFGQILREAGFTVEYLDAATDDLDHIKPEDDDLLIVLGGPISVNQVDEYPFLETELKLLRERLAADMPTLGVCLGAQLIARALGAEVTPGEHKEIGWAPIQLNDAGSRSVLRHLVGENVNVLHWHGETFDIPEDAQYLASSEQYPNQAFSLGKTLALQFHPEVTARGLEQWFVGHTAEIHQTEGISVQQLREDSARFADTLQARAYLFFTEWLEQVFAD